MTPLRSDLSARATALCGAAALLAGALHAQVASYPQVTNTQSTFANFNVEVVRGFVVRQTPSLEIFSVNAYASTITRNTSFSGAPIATWRTLTNPVSIAFDGSDLLVVGQGNHALARHDSATGAFKDVLMLRSEPADIVIDDDRHHAFVSCMGDDSVVEVDLGTTPMSIVRVWKDDSRTTTPTTSLPMKRPRFLSIDMGASGAADNVVYVAPLISGNNTLISRAHPTDPKKIFDGNSSAFATNPAFNGTGLPDYDLFRLNLNAGTVEPVLRGVGSLLTAHGRNPVNGRYWMLNVNHLNAGSAQSEPALRGKFADNRLAITNSLPASGSLPIPPTSEVDIDDTVTGPPATYTPSLSVSFPYALAFRAADGWGAVGSSTTPIVSLFNASGRRQQNLLLANPGSIQGAVVRTVAFVDTKVLAYCQQTSNIAVFELSPFTATPVSEISLGNDPTPPAVKAGRAIWYDATRSLDGRTTCNTCHPQGGADGLVWPIGDVPVDDKGPMVTQPLLGIEDTFPYHWRGERNLNDFNGAFPGLLGAAAPLSNTDRDRLNEFIFSLRPPANPLQDNDRQVKDLLMATRPPGAGIEPTPLIGHPVNGLGVYTNTLAGINANVDALGSCVACHTFPTGSNDEFFPDHAQAIGVRSNFEVAHLNNQLTLKDQPIVDVLLNPSGSLKSNLLGSGNANDGTLANLFDFVKFFFRNTLETNNVGQGDQLTADLASFVRLFDTGTAPSVHWATRLDSTNAGVAGPQINQWLLAQAATGWVGAVAIGTYPVSGVPTAVSWYYEPRTLQWVPERTTFPGGTLAPVSWTTFLGEHTAGHADNVVMGVPPGNERRLGIDFDSDGLETQAEISAGTDPWNPDCDGDGWSDGYEVLNSSNPLLANTPADLIPPSLFLGNVTVDFVSAKVAKIQFLTREPTTWKFTFNAPGFSAVTDSRLTADSYHTAVVQALFPSPDPAGGSPTTYTWTLELEDPMGNTTSIANNHTPAQPDISTGVVISGNNEHVVSALSLSGEGRVSTPPGSFETYSATVNIEFKKYEGLLFPNPSVDFVPIIQVLKQSANGIDWERVLATDFVTALPTDFTMTIGGTSQSYSAAVLPGPYLVLPRTSGGGTSAGSFAVKNLTPGQKVRVNVFGGFPDGAHLSPNFTVSAMSRYFFPAVPTLLRSTDSTM